MRVQSDLTDTSMQQAIAKRHAAAEATDILTYYLDNYNEVYSLICDKCKETLAIEYFDESNPNSNHHQQRQVIAISEKMRSYRKRLDGAMGYQCSCGNDTKLAEIEAGIVPVAIRKKDGSLIIPEGGLELHPHHVGLVEKRIAEQNYYPKIRNRLDDTITETFRVRKLHHA
jgi:hypothetical protein